MKFEADSQGRISRWRGRTFRAVVFLLLLAGTSHMIGCNGLFYYPSARQYSTPADLAVPVEAVTRSTSCVVNSRETGDS